MTTSQSAFDKWNNSPYVCVSMGCSNYPDRTTCRARADAWYLQARGHLWEPPWALSERVHVDKCPVKAAVRRSWRWHKKAGCQLVNKSVGSLHNRPKILWLQVSRKTIVAKLMRLTKLKHQIYTACIFEHKICPLLRVPAVFFLCCACLLCLCYLWLPLWFCPQVLAQCSASCSSLWLAQPVTTATVVMAEGVRSSGCCLWESSWRLSSSLMPMYWLHASPGVGAPSR